MANANTPYIAKAAAPLVNPTAATIFTTIPNSLATIAATQPTQSAYVVYKAYAAQNAAGTAVGASSNQNIVLLSIKAAGRVVGGTTTNFTPTLYFGRALGTGNIPGTGVVPVGSLTATAFNSASGNWYLNATLIWDFASGQINGSLNGVAGSGGTETLTGLSAFTPITGQTLSPQPTSVAQSANYLTQNGELALFFSVGGVFSASNAGNIAYLDLFQSEEL
jgi:hypothetical protein